MSAPIPILMYHQIDFPPKKGTPLRGLVVSPSSFAWQMQLMDLLGYRGLSMHDLEPYLRGEKKGKVVGITFDDGYQNNLEHALPALLKHGFTATCYGVSTQIGGSNIWDIGKVAPKPLMSHSDWAAWIDSGMEVGSHTRTHANLNELSPEMAWHEIATSKQELEHALCCEVKHFCYPYGKFKDEHQHMVRDAGYSFATTTLRGRVHAESSPYLLQRIMVARATNPLLFWAKIATRYEDRHAQ